jgi:phage terminase small subunit
MDTQALAPQWDSLLSSQEREVVAAYLTTRNKSATARHVGISATQVANCLQKPEVVVALRMAEKNARETARVTPEEVIMDLRAIRDMCMGRLPTPISNFHEGELVTNYAYKFDPSGANKAVENLGRVVGMFTDKKEISMPVSDHQLKARLEEILGVVVDGEVVTHTPLDEDAPKTLSEALEALSDAELATKIVEVREGITKTSFLDGWDE